MDKSLLWMSGLTTGALLLGYYNMMGLEVKDKRQKDLEINWKFIQYRWLKIFLINLVGIKEDLQQWFIMN